MAHLGSVYPNQPPPNEIGTAFRVVGSQNAYKHPNSAAEVACSPKETAGAYFNRELTESLQHMTTISNRLSAAKKRLQDHFGVPVANSTSMADVGVNAPPYSPGTDGTRSMLNDLALRLESIASGMEELI